MDTNVLYYGDNLKILREHISDNSIDLIYLDPPFNSKATYNVLFKEPSGKSSEAQITAFEDSWHWGIESERTLLEIQGSKSVPPKVKELTNLLPDVLGRNDMMAYLTMMAIRLVELSRVLKDTGSIYLHCDPTASHYLKLLMDAIFGVNNFQSEVIWKRTSSHNRAKRWGPVHDTILFYSKTENIVWNRILQDYNENYVEQFYRFEDNRGRYQVDNLTGPGVRTGDCGQPWHQIDPTKQQRHWEPPPDRSLPEWFVFPDGYAEMSVRNRLDVLNAQDLIYWPKKQGGVPRYKRYLIADSGTSIQDIIIDIPPIQSQTAERLGYPTQKPIALLERIIKASCNEGDLILDPFCGCGTALIAAQKLNRKWIGIDITHLAIGVMKWRLDNMFPGIKYTVKGEPEDLEGAKELARQNKYEFQWWAVSKIGGQPYGDKKKGADTGIDGYLYFTDYSMDKDKVKKAIISVKAGGQVHSSMIRDLGHVIDREKADFGIFITLEKPTEPMVKESATKGFYSAQSGNNYPRIQILTIEDIMQGKKPNIPMWVAPIQPPPVAVKVEGKTKRML
ncbi:MAG: DNA methyltransferase [Chloroflexi bacterium]|nr:DNA methyltransferase [Chloroflexota bacterium]